MCSFMDIDEEKIKLIGELDDQIDTIEKYYGNVDS